ncbi:MAG TPA: isoprenylcysteine carboxylmethyltransferase family protein [Phototrophicaceae bacterium]|nr:isoprenylcysteine carboxylmethyltransferase family protein [Phototrophicaceae bacterium]
MSRAQLYVVGQFVLFALLALALIVFPPGQTALLRGIGLLLIVIAFLILALAVREFQVKNATLPNITPTPNAQAALVDTGIYAHVRHPIYTAVLVGALGVALAHGHVAVLLIALVMIVFFTYKSMYEESLLRVVYPQYDQYRTHTGRFLPFL